MILGEEEGWWMSRICPVMSGGRITRRCFGSQCTMWEQRSERTPIEGNKIKVGVCNYVTKQGL